MSDAKHWSDKLVKLHACNEAVEWAKAQPSLAVAWKRCERGDWMLWLLAKHVGEPGGAKHRELILTACACARLALKYVPKGEMRPLTAIETAEKWARGEGGITLDVVRQASSAASSAAHAAASSAAAHAAYAAHAASAAYAADAASAASAAADDADDARAKTFAKCAAIARKMNKAPKLEVSRGR